MNSQEYYVEFLNATQQNFVIKDANGAIVPYQLTAGMNLLTPGGTILPPPANLPAAMLA